MNNNNTSKCRSCYGDLPINTYYEETTEELRICGKCAAELCSSGDSAPVIFEEE